MSRIHTPEEIDAVVGKVIDSFWYVMHQIDPYREYYDSMRYYLYGHCVSLVEILCAVFGESDNVKIYKQKDEEHYVTWINGRIYDAFGDRERHMHDSDNFVFNRDIEYLDELIATYGRRYYEKEDAMYTDRMIEVCKEMVKQMDAKAEEKDNGKTR